MLSKLSIFVLLLAETSAGYLLPSPPGKYNVILKTGSIDDYSRDARRLMLSVFQPATCATTVPAIYMPNTTAELEGPWISRVFNVSANFTPLLAQARLPVCSDETERCSFLDDAPVLLLSPGFRGSRLYYNFIAAAIASEGFTVITMDHPGETHAITYSDGHVSESDLPDPTNLDELTPLAYIRATDISFIIDQMNNATAMSKLLALPVRPDRVIVGGHSLGGAAAMLAAAHDSRICGVVNWDGPFLGSLPPSGLSQPIIYIATERPEDPRFLAAWPNLHGPKLWVNIANLLHEGMMDFATLLQAAGQNFRDFAGELGSITPTESVRILTAYTTEWTKGAFAGKIEGSLLEGQEPDRFPDVSLVRKDNF